MVMRPLAGAVLAGLVLAGCAAVGPNYQVPAQAMVNDPAAQGPFISAGAATRAGAPPDGWWKLFADPRLDAFIEQALHSNTDLRVAQANLERAQALLTGAGTAREPDIAAGAGTSWTQQSAEAALQHVKPREHEIYDTGLAVSYDLDLFGGIRRGIEAASADDEAAVAARDLVRINVAAETVRAYADICNAGHQLKILSDLLATQTDDVGMTQRLISQGRLPQFEKERQQSLLDTTQARMPQLLSRRRGAAFRLSTLVGLPPAQFNRTLFDCQTPLQLQAPLPVGDGRELLRRRPDVRAAERRLAAATARIGIATAELYPDIRLGAAVGSTGGTVDFLTPLTNRFAVGPLISWNLHHSAVRARIAAAQAQSRASLAVFDGVVLTALRETETTLDAYAADLERLEALTAARDSALQVAQHTHSLRTIGRVGSLAVLDAERTRIAAEQALASGEADINADQIAVFLALGGGWGQ